MLLFIKIILLISPLVCWAESSSSFYFNEEEGLKQINSSEKKEKQEEKTKAHRMSVPEIEIENKTDSETSKPEDKILETEPITHSISEDFAPQKTEQVKGAGFLNSFFEDSSWFFQKKESTHKIGITPQYKYDKTQGHRLGLSLFSYSPKEKGYYINSSISTYLFRPFFRFGLTFIGNREKALRIKSGLIYDNHYETYYGDVKDPQAMQAPLSDKTKIYSDRFIAYYDIYHQEQDQDYYLGLGAKAFFRKERASIQNGKSYFDPSAFVFLRAFLGFDTRDNWKDPKTGAFHQVSLGCKAILSYPESYCQGNGDLRFYLSLFKESNFPLFKDSVLALRAFAGSSFLSSSSYSTKYSLAGYSFFQSINTLRGFKINRFIGDKIYFAQSELRFPIWDKYLQGVVFIELGEVAEFNKTFSGFVMDYGAGLRIGLPPKYDMKLRIDYAQGRDLQGYRNYDVNVSILQVF